MFKSLDIENLLVLIFSRPLSVIFFWNRKEILIRSSADKTEVSCLVLYTESFFITATIDSEEGRNLTIIDISNAFAQMDMIQ